MAWRLTGCEKHLTDDFDAIYILDLGGNIRKNPKLSGRIHNVFGISGRCEYQFFHQEAGQCKCPRRNILCPLLMNFGGRRTNIVISIQRNITETLKWQLITPDRRYTWLTEGLRAEFETFIPMGTKEAKVARGEAIDVIFKTYSLGVSTNRDAWVYNFDRSTLIENMSRMIDTYNDQVFRWEHRGNQNTRVDDFVAYNDTKIKWSYMLKQKLKARRITAFSDGKVRKSQYRPFTQSNLYFDRIMNDAVSMFPYIFPTPEDREEKSSDLAQGRDGMADVCADD